jgi:sporadic carbohydrate cluster protein (TIGR04323 family)
MRLRGYMGARMALGRSVPQSVQQLVMREHCRRHGLTYLLAATEYCLPGSTVVLGGVLDELDHDHPIDGILFYSVLLFPARREERMELYRRVLERGAVLHTAVEGIVVATPEDARRVEDTFVVMEVLGMQDPDDLRTLGEADARDQLPRRLPEAEPA